MKKKALVITMAMAIVTSVTAVAFALNSIGPEAFVPQGTDGTVSTDVDPSTIENEEARNLVVDVNNGEDIVISEYVDKLPANDDKDDATEFPTTEGYDINTELYDRITDFYDITNYNGGEKASDKGGEVSVVLTSTIGMSGSDLMVVVIDKKTGELFMVPLSSFDSKTGKMTFTMPCNGVYCIAHKIPIVVRNVDPDKYPNKELAAEIKTLPANEVLSCDQVLKATGQPTDKLEVADGVTVNPEDYSSAIALSDIAVSLGSGDFSYGVTSKFKANLFRGNDKVDWERILKSAGVDYDKDAIMKDDSELTKLDPITLKDTFVYHIDATTKKVSIIYEPTVYWANYDELQGSKAEKITKENVQYFDIDDIEQQNDANTQLNIDEETEENVSVLGISEVYAGSKKAAATDTEDVCLVINGDQYIGMGPFLLFMPKKTAGFPWWIIVLIILLAAGGYYYYRKKKQQKKAA